MSLADHLRRLRPVPGPTGPLRDPARAGRSEADDTIGAILRAALAIPEASRAGSDYVHASQLYQFCSRQHVLGAEEVAAGRTVPQVFGAPLKWRFDVGIAVHDLLRDKLADAGLIEGRWWCARCESMFPSATDETRTCRRPIWCEACGCGTALAFREPVYRNEEHHVVGSPDAIHVETRIGREPLEIKSIESAVFRLRGKLPLPEHVFRSHLYCWLTGLPRARILYASTGIERVSPFREFVVRFDVRVVEHVTKRLAELRDGSGIRACKTRNDARATRCPLARECWSVP